MVRAVLTMLLLAGLFSACDDGAPEEQNQSERAVDGGGRRSASSPEAAGPYRLVTEFGDGDETLESIDLCSLVTGSPDLVAAVVDFVGPLSDSHVDKHACVLTGVRDKRERAMQIVVTTDPSTNLADSFGIDSRGYQYRSGPCLITAAAFQTVDGYLAAAGECDQGVWVAVATPAYPDAEASQVNAVLEASIKGL